MNRKNRFNMLEIEHGDGNTDQAKALKNEINENKKKKEKNNKNKRDFKVIIDQKDFDQNLKKHKLKIHKEDIKKEKVEIKKTIKELKKLAYLQIAFGVILTLFGIFKMFESKTLNSSTRFFGTSGGHTRYEINVEKSDVYLDRGNYLHLLSIIAGLYLVFKKKKGRPS